MNKTMCPGQDTRYWRPDDIFNVPCGSCGSPVEFFKDDAARRCPKCGTRVTNPRLSIGCARWCPHAKECLGYDPHDAEGREDAAARPVSDRIADALKRELGAESEIVLRSLAAYGKARELVRNGAADPAVVFPAVLLALADGRGGALARRVMEEACVERGALEEACGLIRAHHAGRPDDTPELRVVREALAAAESSRGAQGQDHGDVVAERPAAGE